MASWYVQTDVGNLFIPDHYNASAATARSMARQWARTFSPDIADEMNVTENPSGFGSVNYGDSVWGGYGVPAGAVNPSNYVQIQDNVTSGKKWDFVETTDVNKGGFSNYSGEGKDTEIQESRDLVDPVQGFLKGLGFDFSQGASAARDFQQRMGRLGQSTFAAQRAADFFDDAIPGGGPQDSEQFARGLGTNMGNRFGSIGTRALENLQALSNLSGALTPVGDNTMRQFVNPYSGSYTAEGQGDLQAGNIANLLTAAFQGAGVSPLYANQVRSGQVEDMFTRYANANPNLGSDNQLDQNFLKYASDQLGLSRFFQ
jgi:hypothetical protein